MDPTQDATFSGRSRAHALRLVVGALRDVPDDLADDGLAATGAAFLALVAETGLAGAAFQ